MKGKRIWILMLCCMLVLSLAAVPGRAADTGKTYTVTETSNINDEVKTHGPFRAGIGFWIKVPTTAGMYHFKEWEGTDGLTFTEGNKSTNEIEFIMPEHDVALKAIWETNTPYPVAFSSNITDTVGRGRLRDGSNDLPSGGIFSIEQPARVDDYRFWAWEGTDGLTFTEGNQSTNKIAVIVPERAISLKALYIRFDDVLPDAYYFDPVVWAVERGVTNGTTDTTFSPGNTCTTANILTFLWRANGSPEPSAANPFSDVPSGSYYEKAAVWAYENGLVSGNTFNGGSACTRAATMKYLWILAGRPASGTTPFTDVSPNTDYAKAVSWAVAQGVTNGTTATTFSPDNTCTRGQIATFLYRHYAR